MLPNRAGARWAAAAGCTFPRRLHPMQLYGTWCQEGLRPPLVATLDYVGAAATAIITWPAAAGVLPERTAQ